MVLKQHIFPFLLAVITGVVLFISGTLSHHNIFPESTNKISSSTYFPYYTDDLNTELWLRNNLKNKSLVFIGSSELTAQTRKYIPNKFINDSLGIPCIAFGKGGNQCFSIFCQLLSFNKDLPHSRVVIVLSPGWFDEYNEGTSLEMFLLYNNKRTLGYILNDDSIPARFKNYIGSYVSHSYPSISSPDETLAQFFYNYNSSNPVRNFALFPFASIHRTAFEKRNSILSKAYEEHCFPYPVNFSQTEQMLVSDENNLKPVKEINWDSLCKTEFSEFKKHSGNNSFGIDNDYYNDWVRGKALKKNKNISLAQNQEYQDFLVLADLLQYYKVDAYFMIQGLNPYAFEDLSKLNPTIEAIDAEIHGRGFESYNMFTSDKSKYVKGTLNDIMHTGEYGWLKADSAVLHHYFKQ
jgi:D-alanine transfer protein